MPCRADTRATSSMRASRAGGTGRSYKRPVPTQGARAQLPRLARLSLATGRSATRCADPPLSDSRPRNAVTLATGTYLSQVSHGLCRLYGTMASILDTQQDADL